MNPHDTPPRADGPVVGPLRLGEWAHGGSCVARADDGRVVFVRHGLPGELVTARVLTAHATWWQAEVAEVLEPSPDRVTPPCPLAGVCGGCDLQHAAPAHQRHLKAEVVAGLLRRFAGVDVALETEAVPGDRDGLAWRTRQRYLVTPGGLGFRAWRSHEVVDVPVGGCPLAHPGLPDDATVVRVAADAGEAGVAVDDDGGVAVWHDGRILAGEPVLTQRVGALSFRVRPDGFWQVHPGAATTLAGAVAAAVGPCAGQVVFDLYCGAGLFAGVLAAAGSTVRGVESSRAAVESARLNVPAARFTAGRVEQVLARLPRRADAVVLDPPRSGANRPVVDAIAALRPAAIVYVACDPAALARDVRHLAAAGYRLAGVRVFDLFPMTHHVETVAQFIPG
ncbi:MAG: methyltransferase [Actinomycetia bacterium]|nr:methyltransferase [Actinomycetes bacterium]